MPKEPWALIANSGAARNSPALASASRTASAEHAASATGTIERGRHSNNSSSTASNTAATGVANTAVMPPAAPATSSVRRCAAVRCRSCPTMLPSAPPVTMIGPSAPNGPPVPILTALEIGFSTASLGSIRLPRKRIVSIASGIPWPRMRSEPTRAITPTINPPTTGTNTLHTPNTDGYRGVTSEVAERPRIGKMRDQPDQVQQRQGQQRDSRPH